MPTDTPSSLSDAVLSLVFVVDDEGRKARLREIAARIRRLNSNQLDPEYMLRNLLAIIHRDGGHHTERVGLAQSCADAVTEIHRLRGGHERG